MTQNETNIDSDGGMVSTGNIEVGDDFVAGDQHITINQILEDQSLTNEATILAYLENAAQKMPPPYGAKPEFVKLWNEPFYAHAAKDSRINPVKIWNLVRDRCEFAYKSQLPQSMLLLANAGMGKTGALHILMDARAARSLINYKSNKAKAENSGDVLADRTFIIPIMLDLELLLDSDMSMNDLVSDAFNGGIPAELEDGGVRDLITKAETEAFLGQYTCLFLIDNLDILITKSDHYLIKMVRRFINLNHRHQFVVACRPTNYQDQLGRLDRIFLNELLDKQVDHILEGPLLNRLRGPMRQLAKNRSHLRMIIEIPSGRRAQGFPPLSKGHLMQHAERKRLDEAFSAERERNRVLDVEVAEEVLERLAFEMSKNGKGQCTDSQAKWTVKEFLEEWDEPYNWRVVMNELRAAQILKRIGRRSWGFQRRKSEAYFSAVAISENLNKIDNILDTLTLPRGNETLEILTGLLKNPEHLLDKLIDEGHIFTATHCAQFASRELDSRTIEKLFEGLTARMQGEHASRRAEIALQLGESGHAEAIRALIYLLITERSSLVVKSIAMAIWVCINQNDPGQFDKILHRAVESLKEADHLSSVDIPDAEKLLDVLHIFERSGHQQKSLAEQHSQLIDLINSPDEHRLIRGLAGFGLGFMADGLLQGEGETHNLNLASREMLLTFLEFRYEPPTAEGRYADGRNYADSVDNLFVSWCCTDALTQLDHNTVLTTAIRLCETCTGAEADQAEMRAQAVYIMGILGRRTAHKHDLVARTLLNLLQEEPNGHNVRAFGYGAQAVSRLWIDEMIVSDPADSDTQLRSKAAGNLVKCRDLLEIMMAESHHSWLRRKISEALGNIGTERALELLNQQVRLERSRTRSLEEAVSRLSERIDPDDV